MLIINWDKNECCRVETDDDIMNEVFGDVFNDEIFTMILLLLIYIWFLPLRYCMYKRKGQSINYLEYNQICFLFDVFIVFSDY
jgi:hypothetical protein